jgi:hypothetical protein
VPFLLVRCCSNSISGQSWASHTPGSSWACVKCTACSHRWWDEHQLACAHCTHTWAHTSSHTTQQNTTRAILYCDRPHECVRSAHTKIQVITREGEGFGVSITVSPVHMQCCTMSRESQVCYLLCQPPEGQQHKHSNTSSPACMQLWLPRFMSAMPYAFQQNNSHMAHESWHAAMCIPELVWFD